jgi:hypothetical protein
MADANAPQASFWTRFVDLVINPYTLFAAIGIAFIGFIFWVIGGTDGAFLNSLQKVDVGRGLITFLVAIATVVVALILVLYPLITSESQFKERYGLGKEVLTALIGILGTIVGFYFGSAERAVGKLELAEVKVVDTQVLTNASGGAAPYRYTIRYDDKAIENKVSDDGWIIESLDEPPKTGTVITVEVTDSRDQKVTKKRVVPEKDVKNKVTTKPRLNP